MSDLPAYCPTCGTPAAGAFCASCGSSLAGSGQVESAGPAEDARNRHLSLIAAAVVAVVAAGGGGAALVLSGHTASSQRKTTLAPAAVTETATPTRSASTEPAGYSDFAALYAAKSGAIVRLTASGCDYDSVGTGFFIDAHHIATVAHVVAGASSISAQDGTSTIPVKVVGTDVAQDVALLYTATAWSGPTVALQGSPAKVGASVAALGFPKGLPLSLSRGSVSAVDQTLTDGVVAQHGLIQTDASLNHGNSGGPLITLNGTAIGLVDSGRADANNISYAVGAAVAAKDFAGWPDSGAIPPTDCGNYNGTPYDPTIQGPADSTGGYAPSVPDEGDAGAGAPADNGGSDTSGDPYAPAPANDPTESPASDPGSSGSVGDPSAPAPSDPPTDDPTPDPADSPSSDSSVG